MPAYRDNKNKWRWRTRFKLPNGEMIDLNGTPEENSKQAAIAGERAAVAAKEREFASPHERKEVPTFEEWFHGRFWTEWVIGRKNKPGEQEQKRSIYRTHLGPAFGHMRLDQIGVGEVARFRASLIDRDARRGGNATHGGGKQAGRKLSDKRINNILTVLSKALRYAHEVELIDRVPRIGLFKLERPEIGCWDLDQYPRILAAACEQGPDWYVAVCLAGEAGMRVGEIRALRWGEDVDMIARTITINHQMRSGITGTPKGRTRRTVPMTPTLHAALKSLDVVRTGYVVRNQDGTPKSDGVCASVIYRICRRAGLPERSWHVLRHSFGTHAAMFGVNPWRLMTWMGHKRIDETMIYVNFAGDHMRPLPPEIVSAPGSEIDPDRRIIAMLGARCQNCQKLADAAHADVAAPARPAKNLPKLEVVTSTSAAVS